MARPINKTPLPAHPAVGNHFEMKFLYGRECWSTTITCPTCGIVRWCPAAILRGKMRAAGFSGRCNQCNSELTRVAHIKAVKGRSGGRRVTSVGYVALHPVIIDPADMPMFNKMRNKVRWVFEHRWVMAKKLGRPLLTKERVDHMNGNKQDNRPENLRIYTSGKQEPGSCAGYGTFYDEWQRAEARARELEREVAALRRRTRGSRPKPAKAQAQLRLA